MLSELCVNAEDFSHPAFDFSQVLASMRVSRLGFFQVLQFFGWMRSGGRVRHAIRKRSKIGGRRKEMSLQFLIYDS